MVKHQAVVVYGGIDTHANAHHVAVVDHTGRRLGDIEVPATSAGYQSAVRFLKRWPGVVTVGVECTGSYGAGVTRVLREAGMDVIEVNQPN